MILLCLLMLFITKQDTPPSNKAGKLLLNAQTLSHLATGQLLWRYKALLSQNVHRLKRANSAKRIIIHHCTISFITGKTSKCDSSASARSSATTKLTGTFIVPSLISPHALETSLQIWTDLFCAFTETFASIPHISPSPPNTALFTNKTIPSHSAVS